MTSARHDSLIRRIRFAQSCRFHLDLAGNAIGLRRKYGSYQLFYRAIVVLFDLIEALRAGGHVDHLGHAHYAALLAPGRLEQNPRYRGYWYDSTRNALVGVLLGLDLHRYKGRYYLLESNLTAALMTRRRALYDDPFDPFITELVAVAKKFGFEQIVLFRSSWSRQYLEEFARATRATNVRIVPASAMKFKNDPQTISLPALPTQLAPNTMYVVCTAASFSPIFTFLHHKRFAAQWLSDGLVERGGLPSRLSVVPTYDEPRLFEEPLDPRWPNLVVKLASSDKSKDVLMGRFESLNHVREALGLSDFGGLPIQFRERIHRYWIDRLFPGALTAIYQPFVPPEIVENFPMMMRMEVFISPIANACLSAHGTVGGELLPERAPRGIFLKRCPYNIGVPPGHFVRLDRATEDELSEVAREFGDLAGRAIRKKFDVGPAGEGESKGVAVYSPSE